MLSLNLDRWDGWGSGEPDPAQQLTKSMRVPVDIIMSGALVLTVPQ